MGAGTRQQAFQDKLLTQSLLGYTPKKFISELILPEIQSAQYTGKLGRVGAQHLRIVSTIGGGKGKYHHVDSFVADSLGFDIESHGLEDIVTKRDYRNWNEPFKAEDNRAKALQTLLYLAKEKGLADTLSNTSVITQNTTLVGADQYTDKLNSDPVGDFTLARTTVFDASGEEVNTAIMNYNVKEALRYHPQLLDFLGYKYDRPGGLSEAELQSVLGVQKIFVGTAKYNSAKEGQATSLANVWGNNIIFAVCPDSASLGDMGLGQVALGYTVRLEGSAPRKVYKKSDGINPPESTEIVVEDEYDQLIAQASAAYLIKDAV